MKITYIKTQAKIYHTDTDWVNPSKRRGMDGVFRGLAGLLRGISRGAALPARGKHRPSLLVYLDLHYILVICLIFSNIDV